MSGRSTPVFAFVLVAFTCAAWTGCSRSELSEFGDPEPWQIAFRCADNLYIGDRADQLNLSNRSLEGFENEWASPCVTDQGLPSGPDEVILWEAPAPGVYEARLVTSEPASLFVLRDACDADVPACAAGTGDLPIVFDVAAGESVLFVIDAVTDAYSGEYSLFVGPQ